LPAASFDLADDLPGLVVEVEVFLAPSSPE